MPKLFLQLIAIFVLTQLLGIAVGINLIGAIAIGEIEQPTVVTENPEDPINAIALLLYILVFTAFLLVFMRFFKGRLLFKVLETIVTFTASWIVFQVFIGKIVTFTASLTALQAFVEEIAAIVSIILVALRLLLPK